MDQRFATILIGLIALLGFVVLCGIEWTLR